MKIKGRQCCMCNNVALIFQDGKDYCIKCRRQVGPLKMPVEFYN